MLAQTAAFAIEVEIRDTATRTDDYVTWAPAKARIRATTADALTGNLRVVLTNGPRPDTQTEVDGELFFAAQVPQGQTARGETLELALPQDGSWVTFVVSGKRPSSRNPDAVIEVHRDTATGPIMARAACMVRIRKNAGSFSPFERDEFLNALAALKAGPDYALLLRMHTLSVVGAPTFSDVPDQAHKGAGFLPWHRAFLLQFERALQRTHPHVSLPYWKEETPSVDPTGDDPDQVFVFSPFFMGSNGTAANRSVVFDVSNPLRGWEVGGVVLARSLFNRADTSWCNRESAVLARDLYRNIVTPSNGDSFSFWLEQNPHNSGHGWVGGWMTSCQTSPQDPIFWLFHCDIDRLWAKWQRARNRFDATGADPKSYQPNDAFAAGSSVPRGHHLRDTMWPWDGNTGNNGPGVQDNRPAQAPGSLFPPSTIPGWWPTAAAQPRCSDLIDYQGLNDSTHEIGVSYDDVPYGRLPSQLLAVAAPDGGVVGEQILARFADANATWADRVEDGARLQTMSLPADATQKLLEVTKNSKEAPLIRGLAFQRLKTSAPSQAVEQAKSLLAEPQADETLRLQAVRVIGESAMFTPEGRAAQPDLRAELRQVLKTPTGEARTEALQWLVSLKDGEAIDRLRDALRAPTSVPLQRTEAIQLLAQDSIRDHQGLVRAALMDADADVRVAALQALGEDQESLASRRELAQSQTQPLAVRVAALESLTKSADFIPLARGVIWNEAEPEALRASAAASLRRRLREDGSLDSAARRSLATELQPLATEAEGGLKRVLQSLVSDLQPEK